MVNLNCVYLRENSLNLGDCMHMGSFAIAPFNNNAARVFYIFRVFSNVRRVKLLSQCNTRLRLLYLLYDVEKTWRKAIKHAFSMV